ncbi:2-oxoacid:ferredoxin oxidoreductase subunit beta, partial [candidate division KSB1 bacterium]|nr:2-oxoacid:ferredoxin oxidoreductase subunit beta [candidate division KSB1 bacterium]
NNFIYGMTGGQVSPTTPKGKRASTAPYGSFENAFNISGLAQAAGASFVARATVYNAVQLEKYIERALLKKGFSVVEVISPCPTAFGRRNREGTPVDMILHQKENSVSVAKAETMTPEELEGKIITGVLVDVERPECRQEYQKLIDRFKQE